MKITLDMRSLLFGFLAAGLLFMVISFKDGQQNGTGKYRTTIGAKGIVILDTENGTFIIAPEMRDFGKVQWIKGNFYDTYKSAKDNKKVD